MKRNYILLLTVLSLVFVACEKDKDSEGLTYVENYPVITDSKGKKLETLLLTLGSVYTPDYKATLSGNDITSQVAVKIKDKISGDFVDNISTDAPGMYEISYSHATEHEYTSWSEKQSVFVYNPDVTLDISGDYIVDEEKTLSQDISGRFEPKEDTEKFRPLTDYLGYFGTKGPVTITLEQYVPGFYTISDAYFGWYEKVRNMIQVFRDNGYGEDVIKASDIPGPGYISLNPDNTITLISASSPYYGELRSFDAKYDEATKEVSFEYTYVYRDDPTPSIVMNGVMKRVEPDPEESKKSK